MLNNAICISSSAFNERKNCKENSGKETKEESREPKGNIKYE